MVLMALLTIPDILTNPSHLNDSIADVSLEGFTIYGFKSDVQGRAGEIHELVTEADLVRTIDGAPTLTVSLTDPERRLSELNFLSYRITVILDRFAYELVQVKKSGDAFTLTFEEVVVAEMRRRNVARKVAANTMSRVEFGYLLLSELPPVDFVTPPIDLEVAHNELARGKDKPTAGQPPEDTWKALTRIFNEVKWRFWVDKGRVFAAPDTYLIGLPAAATLIERRGGVDDIDYDIDTGKRVDKATIHVLSDRWSLPVGARVDLGGVGPDAGSWIVSEIRRSLFSSQTTVTVIRPQIPLPEPPSQPDGADPQSSMLAGASGAVVGAGGAQGGGGSGVEPAVQFALSKEGGPYVWGGIGPVGYDCSGLVQAAFREVGVELPRVSSAQFAFCAPNGVGLTVDEAAGIRGAILERPPGTNGGDDSGHIAISLGTGNDTIEAMGSAYGIRKGRIHGRTFKHGARVPGVAYG